MADQLQMGSCAERKFTTHRMRMLRLRATVSRTDDLEEQGRRGRKAWAASAAPDPGGMEKQATGVQGTDLMVDGWILPLW